MSRRKIVPVTTKRLISSTFGFEPPLTPLVKHSSQAEKSSLDNKDDLSHDNKEAKRSFLKETSWEKLKKKMKQRSMLWIGSSVLIGTWLVVLSAMYIVHQIKAEGINSIQVTEKYRNVQSCHDDTSCSSPKPYCDTQYSYQCSECISSSQCIDPAKKVCDIFGTRSCHQCLSDRDCSGSFFCDYAETRTCVECFVHSNCALNPINHYCYSGQCVLCVDNTGCASEPINKVCYSQTCVKCASHPDCASEATNNYCSSSQQCVECVDNLGCASQPINQVCYTNTCVQCAVNNDCASQLDKNVCYSNTCVQCAVNNDCLSQPVNQVCSAHQCVQCVTNSDCASQLDKNVCDSSTNTCVQCIVNNDCSSQAVNKVCSANQCIQCLINGDCASQTTNKVCSNEVCVQCTLNVHCPSSQICDLSTNTCAGPCTRAECASRTDGKTKCCGTKCIEDCQVGYICDVFLSQCVPIIIGTEKGKNVPDTTNLQTGCIHCHQIQYDSSGSMFDRGTLSPINYLTGLRYIYSATAPTVLDIDNAELFFQEAPNCATSDFKKSPYITLGFYPRLTSDTVQFENILPVTSQCFFILTAGSFKKNYNCYASKDYQYQVLTQGATIIIAEHTPFYALLGY